MKRAVLWGFFTRNPAKNQSRQITCNIRHPKTDGRETIAAASHNYAAHMVKEDLEKLTSRYYSWIDVFCHGRQLCLSH